MRYLVALALLGACSLPAAPQQTKQERVRTLRSVKQLDAHPLFSMVFEGSYGDPAAPIRIDKGGQWACSLFIGEDGSGNPFLARNFDWEHNPALVLFTDPPDGYASVSMVDLSYLGFNTALPGLVLDPATNTSILNAPFLPFDGMNEHGLAVGMAAVNGSVCPSDPNKPSVGSLRIIRLMLDRAKDVDEAIAVFRKYNIDFSDGPQIHYLLSDRQGDSAVIELKDAKCQVLRGERALTNFYLAGSPRNERMQDHRYSVIADELVNEKNLSISKALDLLERVAQPNTQWSAVYETRTGTVRVATGRRFTRIHRFNVRKPA